MGILAWVPYIVGGIIFLALAVGCFVFFATIAAAGGIIVCCVIAIIFLCSAVAEGYDRARRRMRRR